MPTPNRTGIAALSDGELRPARGLVVALPPHGGCGRAVLIERCGFRLAALTPDELSIIGTGIGKFGIEATGSALGIDATGIGKSADIALVTGGSGFAAAVPCCRFRVHCAGTGRSDSRLVRIGYRRIARVIAVHGRRGTERDRAVCGPRCRTYLDLALGHSGFRCRTSRSRCRTSMFRCGVSPMFSPHALRFRRGRIRSPGRASRTGLVPDVGIRCRTARG
ncbi:hypothetical protein, partial [Nocardia sp. CC201C]|uniref:hypothetical protein n=1 Tax=Nocardia sp. CC201C TaxID=3044575 RepID=UPI0024A9E2B5